MIWMVIVPVMLFVSIALALYWNNHPAVRLKGQIRASVEGGRRAERELGDAYRQAQAAMHETARNWHNRT